MTHHLAGGPILVAGKARLNIPKFCFQVASAFGRYAVARWPRGGQPGIFAQRNRRAMLRSFAVPRLVERSIIRRMTIVSTKRENASSGLDSFAVTPWPNGGRQAQPLTTKDDQHNEERSVKSSLSDPHRPMKTMRVLDFKT